VFVGRQRELGYLAAEFEAARPSLVIVYGRRRVGKSTLLREAMAKRPHVYYQATRVISSLNLEGLKAEVRRALPVDDFLSGLADWSATLQYLAHLSVKHRGLVLVLDEFPYLVDAEPALPSIIQKLWDSGEPGAGDLKLVLCGSTISQMEELLAERNPLYGRKTLALDLAPLPLRDAVQFVPKYAADIKLLTYSIFGGVPFYLRLLDGKATLQRNVEQLLLNQTGTLVDEPTVLLQSEFREVSRYSSILSAIADGCTKYGDIIGRVKEISDAKSLGPYLERLERMRLIRVLRSADATPKERDRRYFIADPLIGFWHRFVRPNLSGIAQGFGSEIWSHQVLPHLDSFMGTVFEEICREHARQYSQEKFSAPAQEIGHIWNANFDIDVAGRLLDGSAIFGECKWWKQVVGENVLDELIQRSEKITFGRDAPKRYFVLYARSGFTAALKRRAASQPGIALHTPQTMLRARPVARQGKKRASR
jgi:AAA+ ATPase superfamily predicted ATPase